MPPGLLGTDPAVKPPRGTPADPSHPLCWRTPGLWFAAEGTGKVTAEALSGATAPLAGGVTWAAGERDVVLNFDGAGGSQLRMPRPAGLAVNAASPWCVAIAARYTGSGLFNIFNLGDGTNGLGIAYWYAAGNGLLVNRIAGVAGNMSVLSADPDVTRWHSYLIGWDATQSYCRIWVDGFERTATTATTLTPAVIDGFDLSRGAAGGPGNFESAMQVRYAYCFPFAPNAEIARSLHAAPFAPAASSAARTNVSPPSGSGIMPVAASYLNRRRRAG